ncbi:MAG: hypothetical protein H6953_13445 [Chromatiaceae bacterium]|nr:hypothetical protein [Chromatiaceae bacterium]
MDKMSHNTIIGQIARRVSPRASRTSHMTAIQPGQSGSVLLVLTLLAVILGGCTTVPSPKGDPVALERLATPVVVQPRWNYLRFRFNTAADGEVDSYLDILVADRILAPIVAQHASTIPLWRFHRRWPDDPVGHRFSLVLYTDPATVDAISAEVAAHPLLQALRNRDMLLSFRVEPVPDVRGTLPEGTSDERWPVAVQREWPYFIMGASRMWLGLAQAEAALHDEPDLHARYRAVEQSLDRLWFEQANHAFLHHLSAIFGYKPALVVHRDIMTF